MKTEPYDRAELEIIRFQTEDVIMTSGEIDPDENEGPGIVVP